MAGMLPGVEAARRRRFHQNSNLIHPSSTRRSSFCLYASTHEFHLSSSNSFTERNTLCDESRLGAEARKAKKRLDERLQPHGKTTRNSNGLRSSVQESEGSSVKRWLKMMRWKSSEQEECAVCLDQLKAAPPLNDQMQLPCGHTFHTNCLLPWLEANAQCPCCRMLIPSSIF